MGKLAQQPTQIQLPFFMPRIPAMKHATLLAVILALAGSTAGAADEAFQDLVNQLPRSANAVVLLNIDKAKNSPMGQRDGWQEKMAKRFSDGAIRVPPQAMRMVMGAHLDLDTMHPIWEAAVVDLAKEVDIAKIAQTYGGVAEVVENREAASLPNGTHVVKLSLRTLAAVSPANRQFVTRWMRDLRGTAAGQGLSPYLAKAAGFSDNTGSEIIMAFDLDGAIPSPRVNDYLARKTWLKEQGADIDKLATLFFGVKGIRLGVRIGEEAVGRVAVDFSSDTAFALPVAKRLLPEILADAGMKIDDLDAWTAQAKGTELSLSGTFASTGLRQLLSVVSSPAPAVNVTKEESSAPDKTEVDPAAASQQHFAAVVGYIKELKVKIKATPTFSARTVWCDRMAGRIEKLPIMGVDQDLIQYSAFVAQQLRRVSEAVQGAGVRAGVKKSQVSTNSPDVYAYGYASGWYGGAGVARYAPRADMRYEANQKNIIQRQEDSSARFVEQDVKTQIIDASREMRIKMTEKYKVEFEF
jgi:hypothetical protein